MGVPENKGMKLGNFSNQILSETIKLTIKYIFYDKMLSTVGIRKTRHVPILNGQKWAAVKRSRGHLVVGIQKLTKCTCYMSMYCDRPNI